MTTTSRLCRRASSETQGLGHTAKGQLASNNGGADGRPFSCLITREHMAQWLI